MTDHGGNWVEALSEQAWEVVSEHRAALGVFGTFFWIGVFAIRERHDGIRLWPYLAVAMAFFIALCVTSLVIARPIDRVLKRFVADSESTLVLASVFGLLVAWIFLFVWLFWLTYQKFLLR